MRDRFYKGLKLEKGHKGIRNKECSEDIKYEVEMLRSGVGRRWRGYIDEEFVGRLRRLGGDDEVLSEYMKENFLEWIGVCEGGKWSIEEYINAVRYCSMRLLGRTCEDSYRVVFPEKCIKVMEEYEREGDSEKKERIGWLARAYNKSKLVVMIMQQSLVPSYILNAPLYQEALNCLAKMIRDNEVKGMAKVKACEAILEATKQPDEVKGRVDVVIGGVKNDAMEELREVTKELAESLQKQISGGSGLKEVSEIELVKGDGGEYEV